MQAGNGQSDCPASDDSYIKDRLERLDQKIESIDNRTQGKVTSAWHEFIYVNYAIQMPCSHTKLTCIA